MSVWVYASVCMQKCESVDRHRGAGSDADLCLPMSSRRGRAGRGHTTALVHKLDHQDAPGMDAPSAGAVHACLRIVAQRNLSQLRPRACPRSSTHAPQHAPAHPPACAKMCQHAYKQVLCESVLQLVIINTQSYTLQSQMCTKTCFHFTYNYPPTNYHNYWCDYLL